MSASPAKPDVKAAIRDRQLRVDAVEKGISRESLGRIDSKISNKRAILIQETIYLGSFVSNFDSAVLLRILFRQYRPGADSSIASARLSASIRSIHHFELLVSS
jgi:hypothetical protein